ncbi:hypothetical protein [Methyloceanibacter sp.]|uniref:hypothetical protein n=1 Tax=Methyloceanibacter sp. TaxID=1965321 RepID=UPI002D1FADED|nr:hypothetical protein [Methyloceanibacter sp.]
MTEEEKTAFLEALWSIMEAFVDDAWGRSPTQLCEAEIEQKSRNNPLKMIQYLHADNDDKPAIPPRAKDQTKKKNNG